MQKITVSRLEGREWCFTVHVDNTHGFVMHIQGFEESRSHQGEVYVLDRNGNDELDNANEGYIVSYRILTRHKLIHDH